MKVIITGGDGFIGWPTALRMSKLGHEVLIIDNGQRRDWARSLTPIWSLEERCRCWCDHTGSPIVCGDCDVQDQGLFQVYVEEFEPDAIIHLAVQPSAPYSMRNAETGMETVENNVMATTSVLVTAAAMEKPPYIIHIGTMGVYGYGTGTTIPEGYVEIGGEQVLHPTNPGSLYHATKVMDQTLFAFFAKNYGLRITDLHQGIVWGTQTPETRMHDGLINRFDYDGEFGTVLNRFLMQAAVGHPLTVHGTGGQTRAFININDTVRCLELALDNPPAAGDRVKIMNQMTEVHRVIDLAEMVARLTGAKVSLVHNPRKEAAENGLAVDNHQLRDLGLTPTLLEQGLVVETHDIARRFSDRADLNKIVATTRWGRAA